MRDPGAKTIESFGPCGNVAWFPTKTFEYRCTLTCNLPLTHIGDHAYVVPGTFCATWHTTTETVQ